MPLVARKLAGVGGLLLAVLAASRSIEAQEQPAVTTVVLVRHAEKVPGDARDPELSTAGMERADELVRALADITFDAVLSTPFIRTRETARPVAEHNGVPVTETPVSRTLVQDIADRILADHRGQTVLVVGHSNTTPAVIRALGVAAVPDLTDDEYDDLFVVTISGDGNARMVQLHYGTPTP